MRMPATSQIHALPPFPPVLAATPPLPWFRLTLFLASIRLLDLSLLRDTCASGVAVRNTVAPLQTRASALSSPPSFAI